MVLHIRIIRDQEADKHEYSIYGIYALTVIVSGVSLFITVKGHNCMEYDQINMICWFRLIFLMNGILIYSMYKIICIYIYT